MVHLVFPNWVLPEIFTKGRGKGSSLNAKFNMRACLGAGGGGVYS